MTSLTAIFVVCLINFCFVMDLLPMARFHAQPSDYQQGVPGWFSAFRQHVFTHSREFYREIYQPYDFTEIAKRSVTSNTFQATLDAFIRRAMESERFNNAASWLES